MSAPTSEPLPWRMPRLDESAAGGGAPARAAPSLEEIEAIERAAHAEGLRRGLADGHAQGIAQAQTEIRRLLAQLEGIIDSLARPLSVCDAEIEGVLSDIAVQVAGELLGRAYAADPGELAALVRTALASTSGLARDVELRLHPDDLELIRPMLPANEPVLTRTTPDPTLARGDVRVHTEAFRLDGRFATRLQAALAALRPAAPEAP